ncbi:hypothetical protein ACIQWS_21705 [Phyllobacterium sp. NPDC097923]|uniref:hypothetical protein n=1 Tax=Phyllobacterium sp. NPDC097923 TaxID=3364404 RepID=UPI00383B9B32
MAKHGAIVIDNVTGDQSAHYYYAGLSNTRAFGKKDRHCIAHYAWFDKLTMREMDWLQG